MIGPILLALLLAACGNSTPTAVSSATPAPVKDIIAFDPDMVVASAKVVPAQVSQLGLTVSALVKEISVREGEQVRAGQTLMVLDAPELEYAAIAAEAAYKSASINAELQDMDFVKVVGEKTGKVTFVALPLEVKFKAIYQADQARALLESARANLAQASLVAPFAGTVASIDVVPGELVQSDQIVLTLASLDDLQIETTDLSERDIHRVKIGQSVDIYVEALDITWPGKVIRISPIAETVGGDVVFPVTIELDEQPAALLWGMTAEVRIGIK